MQLQRRATFVIDRDGRVVEEQIDNAAVEQAKIVDACQIPRKTK
ncbi:MAG TPA: hypothetical protein VIM68_09130 [Thermoanaerobaculia bacterium]